MADRLGRSRRSWLVAAVVAVVTLSGCSPDPTTPTSPVSTTTVETVVVTIEIRSSDTDQVVPVVVSAYGPVQGEVTSVEMKPNESTAVELPGPGRYVFRVGGTIEESTSPTSGCWWQADWVVMEIAEPATITLEVQVLCA